MDWWLPWSVFLCSLFSIEISKIKQLIWIFFNLNFLAAIRHILFWIRESIIGRFNWEIPFTLINYLLSPWHCLIIFYRILFIIPIHFLLDVHSVVFVFFVYHLNVVSKLIHSHIMLLFNTSLTLLFSSANFFQSTTCFYRTQWFRVLVVTKVLMFLCQPGINQLAFICSWVIHEPWIEFLIKQNLTTPFFYNNSWLSCILI